MSVAWLSPAGSSSYYTPPPNSGASAALASTVSLSSRTNKRLPDIARDHRPCLRLKLPSSQRITSVTRPQQIPSASSLHHGGRRLPRHKPTNTMMTAIPDSAPAEIICNILSCRATSSAQLWRDVACPFQSTPGYATRWRAIVLPDRCFR